MLLVNGVVVMVVMVMVEMIGLGSVDEARLFVCLFVCGDTHSQ